RARPRRAARSRGDRGELFPPLSPAAQRLGLGNRAAPLGRDVLREPLPAIIHDARVQSHRRPGESRDPPGHRTRSEEHTSELQSRGHLVCRLLLEKKKKKKKKKNKKK